MTQPAVHFGRWARLHGQYVGHRPHDPEQLRRDGDEDGARGDASTPVHRHTRRCEGDRDPELRHFGGARRVGHVAWDATGTRAESSTFGREGRMASASAATASAASATAASASAAAAAAAIATASAASAAAAAASAASAAAATATAMRSIDGPAKQVHVCRAIHVGRPVHPLNHPDAHRPCP